ncbi:Hypothetical predicted protein [Mytilus galloprovincialis]|uniref:TIR domain-containing protein n=1 Tax=Mytilus galloprovincialis TaxID=29158 RepID=A0A8B6DVS1_MYTGA|nr:Hypothetical predicted protein [Mytilus galloprovincialis]
MATLDILFFMVAVIFIADADDPCKFDSRCICVNTKTNFLKATCARKNLTTIPCIPKNIESISFTNNEIENVRKDAFQYNSILLYLDLSTNKINLMNSEAFVGLQKLETLIISNNNISFTVFTSKTVFKPLVSLQYLDIKHNPIHQVAFILSLSNLQTLKMDYAEGETYFGPEYNTLRNLTSLDLSGYSGHCKMKILTPRTFENLPNVEHLDLSKCQINLILNGTFKTLSNLTYLDLSDNRCMGLRAFVNMTYDLFSTSIKILRINKIRQTFAVNTEILKCHLQHLRNTTITELYMDSNRLQLLEPGALNMLPKTLKKISAGDNQFTYGRYILHLSVLSNVQELNVSYMGISHDYLDKDEDCDIVSLDNSLCDKDFRHNINDINKNDYFQTPSDDVPIPLNVPYKLRMFHYRRCDMRYKLPAIYLLNNSLEYIDASFNALYDWQGPFHNLHNLKYLDLSNNFCSNVSKTFFNGAPNLTSLFVGNNLLGFVLPNDHTGDTFSSLRMLQTLDLAYNRISNLPISLFKSQKYLRTLNLSGNMLENVNFEIKHMANLYFVNLSDNRISILDVSFTNQINHLTKNLPNLTIDMSGNPITCTCDSIAFIEWLSTTNVHLNMHQQECYSIKMYLNNSKAGYDMLRKKCSSYMTTVVAVVSWMVIFVMILSAGLLYRYRWKIRYLYYIVKSKHQGYIKPLQVDNDFMYDVFISYADEDDTFVHSKFLKRVEEDGNISCCVHKRDFIPGNDIASNITSAIHNSRKTVVIMSQNFLSSDWCLFEFNMAKMESIYSRSSENIIFIVFIEQLPSKDLSLNILEIVQSKSYIEYPNDEYGDVVFWEKVKDTLSM